MKVNTLEERVGNRKWHIIEDGEPQQHLQYQEGTWFKTEGLSGKYKADRSTAAPDSSYDVDSWKMQMGYDKIISRQDAATTVVGGLNLQMGQARARIKSAVGNGKIKSDGKGLGGTMTWYKDNGVYVDHRRRPSGSTAISPPAPRLQRSRSKATKALVRSECGNRQTDRPETPALVMDTANAACLQQC